tara:strand:+ start:12986 stop:13708 length:723 start_codon:yes stop_codon:yes gene_type:complete
MKKLLLGILVLGLILIGIFYQSLKTTYEFYQFQNEYPEVMTDATVTWETISFSSSVNFGTVSKPLEINGLSVPIPFEAVYESGEGFSHAYEAINDDHSVTIFKPEKLDFFASYEEEFTDKERESICTLLKRTSATQACDSPLKFYEALLRLNPNDATMFTKSDEKLVFLKLMIIKANSLISGRVSEFETKQFTGYLYHINDRNFSVHLFPNENTMYPINFNDMSESEVANILSHTTFSNS